MQYAEQGTEAEYVHVYTCRLVIIYTYKHELVFSELVKLYM